MKHENIQRSTINIEFDTLIDNIRNDNKDYKESTNRIVEAIERRQRRLERRWDKRDSDINKLEKSFLNKNWLMVVVVLLGTGVVSPLITKLIA